MESKTDPGSISLLLVEDEQLTLDLLVTIIMRKYPALGLFSALNGVDGLNLFQTHRHDIVITDFNMPEMNGDQLADSIYALKPDTKFIVLTGDSGNLIRQNSAGKGLYRLIMKPVVFQDLFAAIDECLHELKKPF